MCCFLNFPDFGLTVVSISRRRLIERVMEFPGSKFGDKSDQLAANLHKVIGNYLSEEHIDIKV